MCGCVAITLFFCILMDIHVALDIGIVCFKYKNIVHPTL